jgi:uncharacterized membrane-anchored protein
VSSARKTLLALAVVALALTAVLAYMAIDREHLLNTAGHDITLPIVMLEPRDPHNGQLRLGFEISRLPSSLIEGPAPDKEGGAFFVTLKKDDGAWTAAKVTRDPPTESMPDRIVLKARRGRAWLSDAWISPQYSGIQGYFLPLGHGRKLEAMARDRRLAALVAVDKAGNVAIKGLIVDGELHEKPLF